MINRYIQTEGLWQHIGSTGEQNSANNFQASQEMARICLFLSCGGIINHIFLVSLISILLMCILLFHLDTCMQWLFKKILGTSGLQVTYKHKGDLWGQGSGRYNVTVQKDIDFHFVSTVLQRSTYGGVIVLNILNVQKVYA